MLFLCFCFLPTTEASQPAGSGGRERARRTERRGQTIQAHNIQHTVDRVGREGDLFIQKSNLNTEERKCH